MALKFIEDQLKKFIQNKGPSIIAIKGAWGTGKTHSWNALIDKEIEAERVGLKKYAYVSLFGINSLEDLQLQTYIKVNDTALAKVSSSKYDVRSLVPEMYSLAKSIGSKTKFPYVGSLAPFAGDMIKDTLICFDDLERAGINLSISDVFGFASKLKEESACKIVFIHHIEKANKAKSKEYKKYGEKVFDYELAFEPTARECVDLIFPGEKAKYRDLVNNALRLDITNIRILSALKKSFDDIFPFIETCTEQTIFDLNRSLPIIVLSKYAGIGNGIPSLSDLKEIKRFSIALDRSGMTEDDREISDFLSDYGFQFLSSFDSELIKIVERGYVIESQLLDSLADIEKENLEQAQVQKYSQSWEKYWNSLEDNEDEVVKDITEAFKTHVSVLNINALNSLVMFLRDLELTDEASSMIKMYVSAHGDNRSAFDLDEAGFQGKGWHTEVEQMAYRKFKELSSRSVEQILEKYETLRVCSKEDVPVLESRTVDDWYDYIGSIEPNELKEKIKLLLSATGSASPESYKTVKEAMLRYASESRINDLRVRWLYGIPTDKNSNTDH